MKTAYRRFRTSRPVRFSYRTGVQHYASSKPLKIGILLAVGAALLIPGGLQASRFAGTMLTRAEPVTVPVVAAQGAAAPVLPASTALPVQDDQLAKKVSAKLAGFPKDQQWSVYIEDITSKRTAAVHADTSYQPAGLAELFLLAPLESKFAAGNWSVGLQGKSLRQCVEAMLSLSDQTCTQAVSRLVNGQYADSFNESLGFAKTKIATPDSQLTTARESGELLAMLRRGSILSDKARRQVFDALYSQKRSPGITDGCTNCRVAGISSTEQGLTHSAGIVTHGPDSYVLVVMSKGGTFEQIAAVTRVVEAELYP